ncbi:MAG: PrpF family protein [Rhodospirillales bacterium]|nr:PrpF family protein [Rhodospirillales bacterium]MBO6785615.1 PrpF family protein [Rhodospirillales bacterium]
MPQQGYSAIFMRGGTSKGVFFRHDSLPDDIEARDRIFLHALGSPDAYGRQLNGMGGGVSSVSKAVIVGPSSVEGADVDYTFAQVVIDKPEVDYSATCGNLSSAVGPFAVDSGLLTPEAGQQTVRVFNTNTKKIYHATFEVAEGVFQPAGGFEIPGVSGTGSRIRLDYLDPGGATSGKLLPSGNAMDVLDVPGVGKVEASLVDASNAVVFVAAERFGKTATESVSDLEADKKFMADLDAVRRTAAVAMGLAATPETASLGNPKIGIVALAANSTTLAGTSIAAGDCDLSARIVSMGQVHRVLPLTGAMCLGVACRIPGSVPSALVREQAGDLRLANPSGVLPVDANVVTGANGVAAESCTVYRTARPLMAGQVLVPA